MADVTLSQGHYIKIRSKRLRSTDKRRLVYLASDGQVVLSERDNPFLGTVIKIRKCPKGGKHRGKGSICTVMVSPGGVP